MLNLAVAERGRTFARNVRKVGLFLTTVLTTGLVAPAIAQTSPHPNLDRNGVDLTTGQFSLQISLATLGSGQAKLPLVAYDGQMDNWSQINLYQSQAPNGSINYVINLGSSFDNFLNGSTTSSRGTGATLTAQNGNLVYKTLDGLEITFSNPVGEYGGASNICDSNNVYNCTLLPASLSGKADMVITMQWDIHENCNGVGTGDGSGGPDCTFSWRLLQVSNAAGYSIAWSYATDGVGIGQNPAPAWYRRTSAALRNGSSSVGSVTYGNPSTGVYTITTPGGKTWQITGSQANVTGVRRPGASSDTITVARVGGNVTSVTKDGITTNYNRTVSGSTATMVVTDALSHQTTVVSDMNRYRPTSVTNALGKTTVYGWDSIGRPTDVTYPEGDKILYSYDGRGNVIETRRRAKPGSNLPDIVQSAAYPASCGNAACNSPITTTDPRGNVTNYGYDPSTGLVTSVTSPATSGTSARAETRYSYSTNAAGAVLLTGVSSCRTGVAPGCVGTGDEIKQTITYDGALNVTSVTAASGDNALSTTTSASYDAIGNVVALDGPLPGSGDTTNFRYDADRNPLGVVAPDPDGSGPRVRVAKRQNYDNYGRVASVSIGTVTDGSDAAWNSFNEAYRSASVFGAGDNVVRTTLSASGTTYSVVDAIYDAAGNQTCTIQYMDPANWGPQASSCMPYQTGGPNGPDRVTQKGYDEAGRRTNVATGVGTGAVSMELQGYTDNGRISQVKDGKNNPTVYVYDGFDRLSSTSFADGSYEQLTYDASGNVITKRRRDGQSIGYGYDNLNRLTSKDRPNNVYWETDQSFSYDLQGHMTGASDSTGRSLAYTYDGLGRRIGQSDNWYGYGNATYAYDAAGNRQRLTWGDGFFVTYEYDNTGSMTVIRENGGFALVSFNYDNLGRRSSVVRGNGTSTSYSYDAVSRLSTLGIDLAGSTYDQSASLSYNPAGQIASRTTQNDAYAWTNATNVDRGYGVNALNQYTSAGGVSFGYDGRGNLNNSGGQGYSYTIDNQLATGPGANLAYDPLGRLFNVSGGPVNTTLTYDGTDVLAEINQANGALLRRYVFGPGTDEPLVWYEGGGTSDRRWLHADERGSVIAVTNGSGNALATNTYDEFGIPGLNNLGRFQFTGQKWIAELGMYDYKARIYSPSLGRFLQTDPIGYKDGINWYNYVKSNPINFVDPSGLECTVAEDGTASDDCNITVSGEKPRTVVTLGGGVDNGGSKGGAPAGSGGDEVPPEDEIVVEGHRYRTANVVCNGELNKAEMADLLSRFAVPGHQGESLRDGTYLVSVNGLPGGFVNTTFSNRGLTVTNQTTELHVFVGTIRRDIYTYAGGTIIQTNGSGNAGSSLIGIGRDLINQEAGPALFNSVDSSAAAYARTHYAACR